MVAVVAIVVVVSASAWAMRRRSADDAHSVEGYRQTLNTLQGIGERPPARSVPLSDAGRPAQGAAGRAPLRGDRARLDPGGRPDDSLDDGSSGFGPAVADGAQAAGEGAAAVPVGTPTR